MAEKNNKNDEIEMFCVLYWNVDLSSIELFAYQIELLFIIHGTDLEINFQTIWYLLYV